MGRSRLLGVDEVLHDLVGKFVRAGLSRPTRLNLDARTLAIEDTRVVVVGYTVESDGKSNAGVRVISLDDHTVELLRAYLAVLDERHALARQRCPRKDRQRPDRARPRRDRRADLRAPLDCHDREAAELVAGLIRRRLDDVPEAG